VRFPEESSVEWSVEIDLVHGVRDRAALHERAIDLTEGLRAQAASVRFSERTLSVRLSVEAGDVGSAVIRGVRTVSRAARHARLPGMEAVARAEAESAGRLADRLAGPDGPNLAGISEIAAVLGVSKQRASQLAKSDRFPPPISRLASGPIWKLGTVVGFAAEATRRPGRPPRPKPESVPRK
jgi:hypothetical protein